MNDNNETPPWRQIPEDNFHAEVPINPLLEKGVQGARTIYPLHLTDKEIAKAFHFADNSGQYYSNNAYE